MDARTLEALKASIKHWENNTCIDDLRKADVSWQSCALCVRFNNSLGSCEYDCGGCPVFNATGVQYCEETPFQHAWDAVHIHPDLDEFKRRAQAELDFLRSLLPADNAEEPTS